jgi:hypothetical protein
MALDISQALTYAQATGKLKYHHWTLTKQHSLPGMGSLNG